MKKKRRLNQKSRSKIVGIILVCVVVLFWMFSSKKHVSQVSQTSESPQSGKTRPTGRSPASVSDPDPAQYHKTAEHSRKKILDSRVSNNVFVRTGIQRFENAELIDSEETTPDAEGNFTRVSVVRSQMKFPLIRIQESFKLDDKGKSERLLAREEMVANQLMITLKPGHSVAELNRIIGNLGLRVIEKISDRGVYLTEFNYTNPMALDVLRNKIIQEGAVESGDKNFVRHVPDSQMEKE